MWKKMSHPEFDDNPQMKDRVPFYWKHAPSIQSLVGDGTLPTLVAVWVLFPAALILGIIAGKVETMFLTFLMVTGTALATIALAVIAFLLLILLGRPELTAEDMDYVNKYRSLDRGQRKNLLPAAKAVANMSDRNNDVVEGFKQAVDFLTKESVQQHDDGLDNVRETLSTILIAKELNQSNEKMMESIKRYEEQEKE